MATSMTLKLDKFHQLMGRYGRNAIPVPCPGLVELVEAGEMDGPRVRAKLDQLLSPHLHNPVKAVVLGCTHYIFLRQALKTYLPEGVTLVDGNEGTARELQKQLTQRHLLRNPPPDSATPAYGTSVQGKRVFLSTSPGDTIPERMKALFTLALSQAATACNSACDTVE